MSEKESKRSAVVDYDQLFPGRFLKCGELLGRDHTLTIVEVFTEELPGEKGDELKGVLVFKETQKHLTVNRTRGESIRAMFGRRPPDWIGKRITITPGEDTLGGEVVPAIRIKGSPDIAAPVSFRFKKPRRRPEVITLVPTGKTAAQERGQ